MEALGIFLQHEQAVADTATLCSLLGTSRAVAQLAQTNCEGRVDLRYYKGSPAFSLWLRKNKRLLRSLNVSLVGDSLNPRGRPAAEKELARGLGGRFADLAERDAHRAAQQLQAAADAAAAAVAAAHSVAALTEFAASFPAGTLEVSATQQMAQRTQRGINEAEAAVATLRSAAEAAGRAAAAAAARADDQGLLLKAFSSPTPSLMVLQALPLGQLTSLDLNFGSREPLLAEGETRADKLQQFTAVIAEMSQLRSLSLQLSAGRCAWHPAGTSAEVLLRGVTTLQQLTELQLGHLGNTSADLQPPVSLRRLAVSCDPTRDKVPLHLAHLTELTELGLIGADVECAHVVVEEDQLPVSLRQLAVGDISSSEPLVGLTNLQSLTVYDCEAPAQLQQLSVLKATLREVRLSYSGTVQPADAAQNWAVLRLRSLKLAKAGNAPLPAAGLHGLSAQASCLQHLDLGIQHHTLPQLPTVLQQLTSLQALRLVYYGERPELQQMLELFAEELLGGQQQQQPAPAPQNAPASTEGTAALVQAVVQLPQLPALSLAGLAPTLWGVAAAVQLTRLELARCGIGSGVIAAVAGSLRQLRVLGLAGNAGVDDAAMAPIAQQLQQLQQLTELQLEGTAVTDAGVMQLTTLRQLRRLTTPTAVTAAARDLVLSH